MNRLPETDTARLKSSQRRELWELVSGDGLISADQRLFPKVPDGRNFGNFCLSAKGNHFQSERSEALKVPRFPCIGTGTGTFREIPAQSMFRRQIGQALRELLGNRAPANFDVEQGAWARDQDRSHGNNIEDTGI